MKENVKQNVSITIMFLVLSTIILQSCSQNSPTNTSRGNNSQSVNDFTFALPNGVSNDDIIARMMIYTDKSYYDGFGREVTITRSDAVFWKPGYRYSIKAGNVSIGNQLLELYSAPLDSGSVDSIYAYGGEYPLINFNNTNYTFSVTGNSDIQPINMTVQSPSSSVTVTSPVRGTNFSTNSPLTITWGGTTDPANSIRVSVTGQNGAINKYVDDTGSITLTTGELSVLGTGSVTIEISRGKYVLEPLSNGKYAVALIFSSHQVECNASN
jgi:hypothetical protein